MVEFYLNTAPPWSLCDLFKAGAADTWERIKFSRMIPNLKIHETTITQNLVYEFKLLQQAGHIKGMRIQEARDEKANGADILLCLVKDGTAVCFALQAKIIYHSSKRRHPNGDYRQMHHTVKKSGSHQVDLLIDYARKEEFIPLYLMYNYVNPGFPSAPDMRHYGCTFIGAEFLKRKCSDPTGNLRKDITFMELHAEPHSVRKPAFPWHELICSDWATDITSILKKLNLDPATPVRGLSVEELIQDGAFSDLTDDLTLTSPQQAKKLKNVEKGIEGLPVFNPKFRFIVDVGANSFNDDTRK